MPRALLSSCLVALALALASCSGSAARFHYEDGEARAVKRLPRFNELDRIHHWSRYVYEPWSKARPESFSTDQLLIIGQWGEPDWVRGPYRTLRRDRCLEWVFLERDHMAQFVDGELVYEGPATDFEKIMIERGLPRHYHLSYEEPGSLQQRLVYRESFNATLRVFSLADGKLVSTSW